MKGEVVDIAGKTKVSPVSDFWHAQMDARLSKIEFLVGRIEKQVWIVVITAVVFASIELVKAFGTI